VKSTRIIPLGEAETPSVATPELPNFFQEDGALVPRHSQEWRNRIRARNQSLREEPNVEEMTSTRAIVRSLNQTLGPKN
jgi:hypothetical protein